VSGVRFKPPCLDGSRHYWTGKKAGKGTAAQVAAAYSPKFLALKQILLDCGVGVDPTAEVHPKTSAQHSYTPKPLNQNPFTLYPLP